MKPDYEALARDLNLYAKSSASCTKPDQTGLAFQAAQAITDLSAERDALAAENERLREAFNAVKWRSVDRDNMEFSATITYSQMDALRAALNHAAEGKSAGPEQDSVYGIDIYGQGW